MAQNSYYELGQDPNNKFNQSKSHFTQRSSYQVNPSLSGLDNQAQFLFSRPLVTTKYDISYRETVSNQLPKLPPIKKKSTLVTESEAVDFIPHEVDLPLPKSSSSSSISTTSSSECRECSLPVIYENSDNYKKKKDRIIQSRWGRGTTLDMGLWEESYTEVIKIRSKEDFRENVPSDKVTHEIIAACSTYLSKSPEIGLYVKNKCELVRMNLTDISALYYHHYLQYLDLTNNEISDLTPLGGIPYLMYLNASQNRLRNVLRFKPPWYLTNVNLSRNRISKIDDLSEFWSIVRLDLSHNTIEFIQGLNNLRHMRYLNLGYNLIEWIENLDNLNIQELNLEFNCITDFKSSTPELGFGTLPDLRTLILRHNKLSTLEFLENADSLRYVDLRYNKISDLLEISHLKSQVQEIDFRGNPCTRWPSYRDVLLFSMPGVIFVDGSGISISEKVSASTMFAPPLELTAARSVTKLTMLEHLNDPNIDKHVTPIDQSTPPLIILSGPPAVKKSILARQIADNLPDRVRYCASHTTRESENDNIGRSSYHSISREEFNEMLRQGEFLSTEELLGNSYGFHVSEIAALASERKIGITHMDLHAALQMQGRYVNAKLILVLTDSLDVHRQWIQEKFRVLTWAKTSEQNLVTIQVGSQRRNTVEAKESLNSKFDFISKLLYQLIETLELPLSITNVAPEYGDAGSPNVTIESPIALPKIPETTSEIEMMKKHITFRKEGAEFTSVPSIYGRTDCEEPSVAPTSVGLKIILDEQSNLIIENEEERRERRRAKILSYRNSLQTGMEDDYSIEDEAFDASVSSEDLFHPEPSLQYPLRTNASKVLQGLYTKIVLQSRERYLQQHLENPGFFSLVIFTDEFVTAYNKVVDFIYEFYVSQPSRKPIFYTEFQKLMENVVTSKTETLLKELKG